jgi:hypothetical protein
VIQDLDRVVTKALAQIETLHISTGTMTMDTELDYNTIRLMLQLMKALISSCAGYFALITIVRLLKEENDPHNSPIPLLEEKEVVLSNYQEEVRIPIGVEERAIAIEVLIKAWNLPVGP